MIFYKEALQYWRGENHKQIFSISEYMHLEMKNLDEYFSTVLNPINFLNEWQKFSIKCKDDYWWCWLSITQDYTWLFCKMINLIIMGLTSYLRWYHQFLKILHTYELWFFLSWWQGKAKNIALERKSVRDHLSIG